MNFQIPWEGIVSLASMRRVGRVASATALAALVSFAADAEASSRFWLRNDDSNGIRFGTGRLHTSLEFESRYDSFAGWEQADGMEQVGDVVLHVKPRVELQVPSRTLRLAADAGLDYVGYTGAESSWTSRQSKLNANLGFNGVLNPEGDVSIELDERFVRSDRTTNLELGVLTISNRNDVFLGFDVTPGGGDFTLRPKFQNTVEFFEPRDLEGADETGLSNVDRWNYMENTVGLDLGYRLSDRTALVFDGTLGFRGYEQEISQDFDTRNLRLSAGFVGMVAPKVELKGNIGYGAQLVSEDALSDEAFGGVIGNAEIGYLASDRTKVHLGYRRDFRSSPTTSLYYSNDRGYLSGQWRLSREFGARMTLAYDSLRFSDDRVDEIFSLTLGPEYQPSDRIAVGATYGFLDRVSTTDSPSYAYDRNEFGAYVAVRY